MVIGKSICTILAFLAISLAPATAPAADGRAGIAYVQAPEMSSGTCTGKDAKSAFACARKQCIDGGGTDEDCVDIAYCFPARFSVDVFVQSQEGAHWHEFYCGWDSKEVALAAAEVACDKEKRPYLMECAPVLIYDEDGNQEEIQP